MVAFVAAVLAAPTPAGAHPFGAPQTVAIAADRDRPEVVHVRWQVGGLDDLTLLGVALGLLPQDRVMLDGAVFFEDTDAATVGPSDRFAAYLLKQITVASGGRPCTGSVEPPVDLARTGASIDYTCPAPVGTATVGVRMLTDLNPAYQTLATGPGGERAVYGSGEFSHDWILGDAPATGGTNLGRSATVQIGAVVGGGLLVAIAVLLLSRRLRPRRAVS
ncbi:hypothetical protein [Micromonospora eburnea]|uniref:hypothetical protein n=1 Tax=Micromonospora eburnea TaxID=227316 RepID=UPI00114D118D|nr:hypothetical protein [Micromonospora eburnea]